MSQPKKTVKPLNKLTLERVEKIKDSKTYIVDFQLQRVEGKICFPSSVRQHPPTALRSMWAKHPDNKAEYVKTINKQSSRSLLWLQKSRYINLVTNRPLLVSSHSVYNDPASVTNDLVSPHPFSYKNTSFSLIPFSYLSSCISYKWFSFGIAIQLQEDLF